MCLSEFLVESRRHADAWTDGAIFAGPSLSVQGVRDLRGRAVGNSSDRSAFMLTSNVLRVLQCFPCQRCKGRHFELC